MSVPIHYDDDMSELPMIAILLLWFFFPSLEETGKRVVDLLWSCFLFWRKPEGGFMEGILTIIAQIRLIKRGFLLL